MAWFSSLLAVVLIALLFVAKITVRIRLVMDGWRPELTMEISAFFWLFRRRIRWSVRSRPHGGAKGLLSRPSTADGAGGRRRRALAVPSRPDWSWKDGRALWHIGRRFLRHVSIEKWETVTQVGTGQAHTTGWLSGWLWALQTEAHSFLFRGLKLQQPPRIWIHPDFQRRCWLWRLDCIASFRLGHAIIAGIRLFAYCHEGRRKWFRRANFFGKGR